MSETTPKPRYAADDHAVYDTADETWEPIALAMGPTMAERIAAALNADEGKSALLEQNAHMCLDCAWRDASPVMSEAHHDYCVHLTPEYWAAQGYQRNWGDAAVMMWPTLEVLCKQENGSVEYLILQGALRRPVRIMARVVTSAIY